MSQDLAESMSPSRRVLVALTIAIVVAWVAFAVMTYNQLPDTIATHFGAGGQPDGFSQRSIVSWFGLTFIGVSTTALVLGLAQYAHAKPDMFNIPGKDKLLALPKDAQVPLVEQLAMWLTIMALSLVLLFGALQYDMWRVATTSRTELSYLSWTMLAWTILGSMILMPIWIFRFERKIDAARDALEPQGRARR
jgi:uncharacterized membrane protein